MYLWCPHLIYPQLPHQEQQICIYQTVYCLSFHLLLLMFLKLLCPHGQPPQSQWAGISGRLKGQRPQHFKCLQERSGTAMELMELYKRGELSPTTNHFPWLIISTGNITPLIFWKTSGTDWSPRIHYPDSLPHLGGLLAASPHTVQHQGAPTNHDRGSEMTLGLCPRGLLRLENCAWETFL